MNLMIEVLLLKNRRKFHKFKNIMTVNIKKMKKIIYHKAINQ
jgi:hypothetical protein